MRLSQAADYIELRAHGLRPRPYLSERIMIVLGGNLLAYVIMPQLERIGTMRQQQITKQPQKRHSERESDPDRKTRRDTRAEHSRRSAAFLRRLDGGN